MVHDKTLIIGLGNTILADDGVGIYAARAIAQQCTNMPGVDVVEASIGGVELLDLIRGYDRVILVDAIATKDEVPGKIYRLSLEDLGDPATFPSGPHFLDVRSATELGKRLGYPMPRTFQIYAVEIKDNTTFSETLTPDVEKAIPALVQQVMEYLREDE
ncbi:MAG: Hydrogenase 2 maturation protease [Syntrophorhabdus sp. PtaU1.Bin002]|nr:MAG: Hydrogenase 2 maturation protease [Syntrophorhabdus sp. PtaB.Bin006]OPY66315.1 MAG: Hydrogenase 2 maturation protease [Syntrophorhabdus sp. PtaU1.Bin002]